jgi:hypothetical protein
MPRVRPLAGSGGGVGGFRALGLYAALLESERDSDARHSVDPRWRRTEAGQRGEEPPSVYRRSRKLLEALEAGKTVVVSLPGRQWGLPWKRPAVTAVTVTVDDVVRPSDARFSHPGGAVDDLSEE